MDLPEHIRNNIKKLMDDCPIKDEPTIHMLTSISYEMYRAGFKDSLRLTKKYIEVTENQINGKGDGV
jgi:hypothetical protein